MRLCEKSPIILWPGVLNRDDNGHPEPGHCHAAAQGLEDGGDLGLDLVCHQELDPGVQEHKQSSKGSQDDNSP